MPMALSLVNNVSAVTAADLGTQAFGDDEGGRAVRATVDLQAARQPLERLRQGTGRAGQVVLGIRTALDNTTKATSLVQTGEGALNEINTLLNKARSLALDSANAGVNDSNAFAANQ